MARIRQTPAVMLGFDLRATPCSGWRPHGASEHTHEEKVDEMAGGNDDQDDGIFWFNAAKGFFTGKPGAHDFQTMSNSLGESLLGFRASGDEGDLEMVADGKIDPNTEVTLDGGDSWSDFKVVASGDVKGTPSLFKASGSAFENHDPDEPLVATVIEVGGKQYVLFPDYPDASGKLPGLVRIDDDGKPVFVCFAAGTMITTDQGEIPVEALHPGTRVLTRDRGYQPLRWVGGSTVSRSRRSAPVLVRADALGKGVPSRDLRVSPQHRILLGGGALEAAFGFGEALVPALHLVNGTSIMQELKGAEVTYFHLLFDQHEVIYSEGLPSESFHPGAWGLSTLDAVTRREVLELFPQLSEDAASYGPAARPSLRRHEARLLAQ